MGMGDPAERLFLGQVLVGSSLPLSFPSPRGLIKTSSQMPAPPTSPAVATTSAVQHPHGDFPGSLLVKTLCFNCRGMGSIPGQRTKIPHAVRPKKKEKTKPPTWPNSLIGPLEDLFLCFFLIVVNIYKHLHVYYIHCIYVIYVTFTILYHLNIYSSVVLSICRML